MIWLEEFKARHNEEEKLMENLEQKYAKNIIAYRTLVKHLTR